VIEGSDPMIRHVDWTEVPPSVAVVETVSNATGREPTELPSLYDTIDSDALDALCTDDGRDTEAITVSFVYAEQEVTVLGGGTVIVEPIEER